MESENSGGETGVYLWRDGQSVGPFTEEALREDLAAGRFSAVCLARREGEEKWHPVSELLLVRAQPARWGSSMSGSLLVRLCRTAWSHAKKGLLKEIKIYDPNRNTEPVPKPPPKAQQSTDSTIALKLTSCPDCGREVSKRAATCPHCGAPIAETTTSDLRFGRDDSGKPIPVQTTQGMTGEFLDPASNLRGCMRIFVAGLIIAALLIIFGILSKLLN